MNSNIIGLLLAAGLSSRMGRNKCLMPVNGQPMILVILRKLLSVCGKVIIVTGHEAELIKECVSKQEPRAADRIIFAHNPGYINGMFSSLQTGLRAAGQAEWVFYHFSDQPLLPEDFYHKIAGLANQDSQWVQPVFNQRRGHPILLHSSLFNSILQVPGNSNLRDCITGKNIEKKYLEFDSPMIFNDIDTPADFARVTSGES